MQEATIESAVSWMAVEQGVVLVLNMPPSECPLQLNKTSCASGHLNAGTLLGFVGQGEGRGDVHVSTKGRVCLLLTQVSNISSGRRRRRVGLKD